MQQFRGDVIVTQNDPIKPTGVLITGGSEGISRALAARYLAAGSQVLVTGRSAEFSSRTSGAKRKMLSRIWNDAGGGEAKAIVPKMKR